jgi:hypothetical protein
MNASRQRINNQMYFLLLLICRRYLKYFVREYEECRRQRMRRQSIRRYTNHSLHDIRYLLYVCMSKTEFDLQEVL